MIRANNSPADHSRGDVRARRRQKPTKAASGDRRAGSPLSIHQDRHCSSRPALRLDRRPHDDDGSIFPPSLTCSASQAPGAAEGIQGRGEDPEPGRWPLTASVGRSGRPQDPAGEHGGEDGNSRRRPSFPSNYCQKGLSPCFAGAGSGSASMPAPQSPVEGRQRRFRRLGAQTTTCTHSKLTGGPGGSPAASRSSARPMPLSLASAGFGPARLRIREPSAAPLSHIGTDSGLPCTNHRYQIVQFIGTRWALAQVIGTNMSCLSVHRVPIICTRCTSHRYKITVVPIIGTKMYKSFVRCCTDD